MSNIGFGTSNRINALPEVFKVPRNIRGILVGQNVTRGIEYLEGRARDKRQAGGSSGARKYR